MGREIIVQIRDRSRNFQVMDEDYVCGRDDATSYIAQLVYNKRDDLPDIDEDNLEGRELSDRYSLIFDISNKEQFHELSDICNRLKEYADKDYAEINRVKNLLEDLRLARRNCSVYEEFAKFSDAMDEAQTWLDNEDYSRAGSLLDMINDCRRMIENQNTPESSLPSNGKYEIVIILSE